MLCHALHKQTAKYEEHLVKLVCEWFLNGYKDLSQGALITMTFDRDPSRDENSGCKAVKYAHSGF